MSLSAEVQSRYPAQRLVELTNPGSITATTVNTTILGLAATDVEADFQIVAGIAYDGTDARHVKTAVEGVVLRLMEWLAVGTKAAETIQGRWKQRLEDLAKVTGRDRPHFQTTSDLTPSEEVPSGETVRPKFDPEAFRGYVPGGG
jgi:hypothetical protein